MCDRLQGVQVSSALLSSGATGWKRRRKVLPLWWVAGSGKKKQSNYWILWRYSLAPVAKCVQEKLGKPVTFLKEI